MQVRRKLKPFVVPVLYGIVTLSLIVSLMFLTQSLINNSYNPISYITAGTLADEVIPVVSESKSIIRPYKDTDVKVLQNYYDYKGDKETQEKSLIYYENTYMQNSGVDYGREQPFDVVSILEGTVIDIIDDDTLGKIVEIQHTNDIIGSYQCLSDVIVEKNDILIQGEKLGTSGTCNIAKSIGNHLHFELTNKGEIVNPESTYDKNINEV